MRMFVSVLIFSIMQLFCTAAAATTRHCVFVHGAGYNHSAPPSSIDIGDYWGGEANIRKYISEDICPSLVFLHHDMASVGWDNVELQKSVCQDILSVSAQPRSSNIISNALLFSHSMGNLVVADALRKGLCTIGTTSKWVSMSAPWRGSKAADWVGTQCRNESGLVHWLSEELNYCNKTSKTLYPAWASLRTTYPGVASPALQAFAARHVDASMCGEDAFGINSKYSVELAALATVVHYGQPNDAMVGISSCLLSTVNATYLNHWRSQFYRAKINHADGTLRNGNGIEDDGKPGLWLRFVSRNNLS